MKKLMIVAVVGLTLATAFTHSAFAAFQGNKNFRSVAITSAAQNRTDWRSCKVGGQMDWEKAETLGSGVIYLPLKLTTADGWERQMYCHAVRVDTSTSRLRFTGNERCAGWGEPNTEANPDNKTVLKNTVREKTADFIARFRGSKEKGGKARDMIFAVNGQGWGGSDGTGVDYVFGTGWAQLNSVDYSDGILISRTDRATGRSSACPGVFVVWKDGTIDIIDTLTAADVPRVWYAITPHMCRLMTDGEITVKHYSSSQYVDYSDSSVRPRTAYGISEDKRYFYAVVLDGDNAGWSSGATFMDTAMAMKATGCWQALNMDGGGSSNIVGWDFSNNRPKVLGRPNGFSAENQRDGGSHLGVYLADTIAKIGTFTYDEWDFLLADVKDGEVPEGVADIDVLADLELATAERVPAGYGLKLADGVKNLTLGAGIRMPVRSVAGNVTVKTADAQGFVLGGEIAGTVTVDCAVAKAAGAAFGTSPLSLGKVRAQLGKIKCAGNAALVAVANGTDGAVTLSWGQVGVGATQATLRANDSQADVSVEVLGTAEAAKTVRLTLTDDQSGATKTYTKAFTGAGAYTFAVGGADFGYTYTVEILDAAEKALNETKATGEILFAKATDWFAADVTKGTATGGAWSTYEELEKVFTAVESGKGGFVRVVASVTSMSVGVDTALDKMLTQATAAGTPHSAMTAVRDSANGVNYWYGMVGEGGSPAWRKLQSTLTPQEGATYMMMQEVSFGTDKKARVRYFSGTADGEVIELLKDASGASSFAGASREETLAGIVRFIGEGEVLGLRATCAEKSGVRGLTIYMK